MIKDQQQQQGRNSAALVGESSGGMGQSTNVDAQQAPPPAYTPNPVFQGLPIPSSGQQDETDVWHPPATIAEADRRARGRFIRALAVGFLIYVLALCLFGAPVEDSIEHSHPGPPPPRHKHDRAGRPVITVVSALSPASTGAAVEAPLTAPVVVVATGDEQ